MNHTSKFSIDKLIDNISPLCGIKKQITVNNRDFKIKREVA